MMNKKLDRLGTALVTLLCSPFLMGLARPAFATSIVVPNANTSTNGNGSQLALFGEGGSNFIFQWELAGSQLTPIDGTVLTGIGFRLAPGQSNVSGPINIGTWDLQISSALNPIGALSTTFANNIGANVVTVHTGALVLPALTVGLGQIHFLLSISRRRLVTQAATCF